MHADLIAYIQKSAAASALGNGYSDVEQVVYPTAATGAGILVGGLGAEYKLKRTSDRLLRHLSQVSKRNTVHAEAWKEGFGRSDPAPQATRVKRLDQMAKLIDRSNNRRLLLKGPLGRSLVIGGGVLGGLTAGFGALAETRRQP